MEILDKNILKDKLDGEIVRGYVYITSYTKQPTKNGNYYLTGSLQAKGEVPFKVWGGSNCFDKMESGDYNGVVCHVKATVNVYNGTKSLIIDECVSVEPTTSGIKPDDFIVSKYDAEAWSGYLYKMLNSTLKEESSKQVVNLILNQMADRFIKEFASVAHHDNVKHGLLVHTSKVVNMCKLVKNYPNIVSHVDFDTLIVSATIHDIGKTVEYNMGAMSDLGKKLSHNTLGIEILVTLKQQIINLKSEDFYYDLLSVVSQHHGEWGERPRTTLAYLVHTFDKLESVLASIDEIYEGTDIGEQIVYDGYKLI